ncbi:hypothetical protein SISNIDRAFT_439658 [Sistotremastrum niveocremeum HHB9708]|uniref:Protein kinase domain-containing protein n=1 Tax=Sistotremastrum niveocremeum HHB9708 TaxID=1314777 RepID=A0A164W9C5_9AGAM|nr:hypothetical protein SISNIDRAFT_439658 [Sistotremastrum niveocremeum HHB9708]
MCLGFFRGAEEERYERLLETLSPVEQRWAQYQPWLERIGYRLRRRYRPGWKPSWNGSWRSIDNCEDAIPPHAHGLSVIDAVRLSDNKKVMLKLVPTSSNELPIWMHLNSVELRADSRNHCVPLFDVHPLPDTDEKVLAVMPLLVMVNQVPFETLGEILRALHSFAEGLAFLHEHLIAHLDIARVNCLMDPGDHLYPKGFHPIRPEQYQPAGTGSLKLKSPTPHRSRTIAPVQYFFIDFGESVRFMDRGLAPRIRGSVGHVQMPDFSNAEGYDPFFVDIRALGYMIEFSFVKSYRGLEFLLPLTTSMQNDTPSQRPNACDVLDTISGFLRRFSEAELRSFVPSTIIWLKTISTTDYKMHGRQARLLGRPPIYPEIPGFEIGETTKPLCPPGSIWERLVLWAYY